MRPHPLETTSVGARGTGRKDGCRISPLGRLRERELGDVGGASLDALSQRADLCDGREVICIDQVTLRACPKTRPVRSDRGPMLGSSA